MMKFFFCITIPTLTSILTAPLFNNQAYRQTPLPFPMDLREYHLSVYLLVYLCQCIGAFSLTSTIVCFDNLTTSLMGISSAYFKILKDTIMEIINKELITNEKSNTNMYDVYQMKERYIFKQLRMCVYHHTALIEFTGSIEDIFTYAFLSQFLGSAIVIGLCGFNIINSTVGSVEFLLSAGFLASLLFQITLYCLYGDAVTIDSSAIGGACYKSEWIYCGRSVRRALLLIMERSKRPLVLTAGKFIDLSYVSLIAILKSASSYMTILRQMTE